MGFGGGGGAATEAKQTCLNLTHRDVERRSAVACFAPHALPVAPSDIEPTSYLSNPIRKLLTADDEFLVHALAFVAGKSGKDACHVGRHTIAVRNRGGGHCRVGQ